MKNVSLKTVKEILTCVLIASLIALCVRSFIAVGKIEPRVMQTLKYGDQT